ncbi:sulfotransferase [Sphingobium sp. AS12]|uniref:sulfotransferase n=1 Tax=Sphingobium sp. AS12 TaxID=2849495 RepID=UPI001C317CB3|nr:sulfotransferase [Sphingobium sp. AS12]MBV2149749.1 sulfotransferase [Sphingobium sp. AS12]
MTAPLKIDLRPVVHIGYHKTGTTWWQDVFYPACISHRYIDRQIVRDMILKPYGLSFDADTARARILEAADGAAPLICEEALTGNYLVGGLHGMVPLEVARRIKAVFPDARIIIGVRSQPGMLTAAFSQYVKVGGTFGPKRFLFPDSYFYSGSPDRFNEPRFDLKHFEYHRQVTLYQELFGLGNVIVLPFEEFQQDALECARMLMDRLGIEARYDNLNSASRNPSLTPRAQTFMRFLNLFTAERAKDKRSIIHIPGFFQARKHLYKPLNRMLPGKGSPPSILGKDTVAWIEARFAQSNRELARLTGIDLASLGYVLDGEADDLPSPLDPTQKLIAK